MKRPPFKVQDFKRCLGEETTLLQAEQITHFVNVLIAERGNLVYAGRTAAGRTGQWGRDSFNPTYRGTLLNIEELDAEDRRLLSEATVHKKRRRYK